jgi:tetratricopeptide (TPR) repeat protein
MADRYTYLPGLGPFLLVGLGLAWVWAKVSTLTRQVQIMKIVAACIAIVMSVSMIYLTSQQMKIWKSSFYLWDYAIAKEPGKISLAYKNRGEALSEMGQFDRAIADYDMAIALNPSNYEAYNNRGVAFDGIGHPDKAIADYDKAIALNPRLYDAYNNKGKIYGQTGSFSEAIEQFNKTIEIKPDFALAYVNRGLAYFFIREYEKALEDLNKAIELDRNYTEAYSIRGNVYLRMGNKELAVSDFRKACDLGEAKACDLLRLYVQ